MNLVPIIRDGEANLRSLFWRVGAMRAIRRDSWKLSLLPDQKPQLFDLQNDLAETRNLFESEPRRVKELRNELTNWQSELRPPLWDARRSRSVVPVKSLGNQGRHSAERGMSPEMSRIWFDG